MKNRAYEIKVSHDDEEGVVWIEIKEDQELRKMGKMLKGMCIICVYMVAILIIALLTMDTSLGADAPMPPYLLPALSVVAIPAFFMYRSIKKPSTKAPDDLVPYFRIGLDTRYPILKIQDMTGERTQDITGEMSFDVRKVWLDGEEKHEYSLVINKDGNQILEIVSCGIRVPLARLKHMLEGWFKTGELYHLGGIIQMDYRK